MTPQRAESVPQTREIPGSIYAIMKKCFNETPESRPSFVTILEELTSLQIPEGTERPEIADNRNDQPSTYTNVITSSKNLTTQQIYHQVTTPQQ